MNYRVIKPENGVPIKAWVEGVQLEAAAEQQLQNIAQLPFIHKWVAAMPDVHWGLGATVGSVIPTKAAIVPAAVGVDLGCFTGDTLVPVLDGNSYPIKQLADSGQNFLVYACTPSGKIVAAQAKAQRTCFMSQLVKVVLDNGQEVRCTPDQQFMLRDGSYREANCLSPGDSLMPCYRQIDKEGYVRVQQNYSGCWQRAHWIVARSGLLGPVPNFVGQKTVIHHKNFDEADNRPENLQFTGAADHSAYHRQLVERNQHWQSPEFEEKRKKAITAKSQTPQGHAYMSQQGTRNLIAYMQERPEHFKQSVAGNGKRGKKFLIAYGEQFRGGFGINNHRRFKHGYNHKVIAVLQLEEREDVYCLTVPEYNNFALEAGVFVHNCGMMAVKTDMNARDLPDNLHNIRAAIEKAVPHGRTDNGGRNDRGAWRNPPEAHAAVWFLQLEEGYERIIAKHPKLDRGQHANHLGTLGTGNHFIEVCLDEQDNVWFMLHSGSRGVGNRIGSYFIELAKKEMRRWFINLPDENLAYLPEGSQHFDDYVQAVHWAQEFAMCNRQLMMQSVINAVQATGEVPAFDATLEVVNCHHNYVSIENHYGAKVYVTRKGAVRARESDLGIIPGSMGAQSFIVRGKGHPESFHSCSHGAGRAMSRAEARRRFSVDDHIAATAGIECRKDADVLDESPGAYKNISAVMHAQRDLVEILYTLRQVVCVKG